MGIKTQS